MAQGATEYKGPGHYKRRVQAAAESEENNNLAHPVDCFLLPFLYRFKATFMTHTGTT